MPGACVPAGRFPAAGLDEIRALRRKPVVERRAPRAARGLQRVRRVMALVDHAERFDGARASIVGIRLVRQHAIDVHCRDVDVRQPVDDPVRHHAAETAAGEDADRVQAGRDEIAAQVGRFADDRQQVGREALRPAEELLHADLGRDRHARHRRLEVRTHALPVGLQVRERHVGRRAFHFPGRAHGLEQADHQAAAFLAVVPVRGRVLEHGHVLRQVLDRLGDQVVVLGRLVRQHDAVLRAEFARPQAGAIDDEIRLDVAERRGHAGHAPVLLGHPGCRDAFEDLHAAHPGALGQRHRHVDRIHAAVLLHVEAGFDVVHLRAAGRAHRPRAATISCTSMPQ